MHLASAKHMQMEMVDGLAAFGTGTDDDAIAFAEALLARNFGSGAQEVSEQGRIGGFRVGERGEVLLWDDEDVGRRFGIDVVEGEEVVVLFHLLRGDCAGYDFAEETVHGVGSGIRLRT
jgi:hypothetical protein